VTAECIASSGPLIAFSTPCHLGCLRAAKPAKYVIVQNWPAQPTGRKWNTWMNFNSVKKRITPFAFCSELKKLPDGSLREIVGFSLSAPQTLKSLVKGERFIRSVWRAWVDAWVLTSCCLTGQPALTGIGCPPFHVGSGQQKWMYVSWKTPFLQTQSSHRFSAFWLRSKCSICSYQLNIWYDGHVPSSILNWFLKGDGVQELAPALSWVGQALQYRLDRLTSHRNKWSNSVSLRANTKRSSPFQVITKLKLQGFVHSLSPIQVLRTL
jgi:hypothetical protein